MNFTTTSPTGHIEFQSREEYLAGDDIQQQGETRVGDTSKTEQATGLKANMAGSSQGQPEVNNNVNIPIFYSSSIF